MILPNIFPHLLSISTPFHGILLDAYGVFWEGNAKGLMQGTKEVMQHLIAEGKVVGILSNSTQLTFSECQKLKSHGLIEGLHFHFLLTSGEAARRIFFTKSLPFKTPRHTFWAFSGKHPRYSSYQLLFAETIYNETEDINDADFIYLAIPHINGKDVLDPELFLSDISRLSALNLPVVCANPDLFAHEGNPPELVVRQGSIAALFEKQGSQVFYIGKPFPFVYKEALALFSQQNVVTAPEVLMVGDTPETDIKGARACGMATALVMQTGISAERIKQRGFTTFFFQLPQQETPDFFIERMAVGEL